MNRERMSDVGTRGESSSLSSERVVEGNFVPPSGKRFVF